jgi:hypothetical protein
MNKELTIRSGYMKEKKEALIVLAIAIPVLCYGAFSFELEGTSNTIEAITVALAVTLGLFGVGVGLLMLFTKTSLGLLDSKKEKELIAEEAILGILYGEQSNAKELVQEEEPKPIIKEEKKMETNEEEYVEVDVDTAEQEGKEIYSGAVTSEQTYTFDKPVQVSESIGLMKREKELQKKCNELTSLLEEADIELRKTQEKLNHKGWISTEKGWVIE